MERKYFDNKAGKSAVEQDELVSYIPIPSLCVCACARVRTNHVYRNAVLQVSKPVAINPTITT